MKCLMLILLSTITASAQLGPALDLGNRGVRAGLNPPVAQTDPIPAARLPYGGTWSNLAGVTGGIPTVSTIYTTLTATATAGVINHEIDNCPSNQVVFCSNGVYTLNAKIVMNKSGVVLRGGTNASGFPATFFNTASDPALEMGSGFNTANGSSWNTVNVTNGISRGSSTFDLDAVPSGGMSVGQLLWLSAPVGGAIDGGSFALFMGTDPFVHIVKLTAVSSRNVSFYPPLNPDFLTTLKASTADDTTFARMGLENISFGGNLNTYVKLYGTDECWIYNCVISNSPNGSVRQVYLNTPNRTEIRKCRFGAIDDAGSDAYCIFGQDDTGTLVENNYFDDAPNFYPMLGSQNCVFSYNVISNCPYAPTMPDFPWLSQIVFFHGCFCSFNLREGNHIPTHYDDGLANNPFDPTSSFYNLIFRSRLVAWDGSDGGKVYNCHAFTSLPPGSTNNTVAGCILGKEGFTTTYDDPGGSSETKSIYSLDAITNSILRVANWNAVTTNIPAFERHYSTQALASSYLYASKPSWFGALSWPPVNPSNVTSATLSSTNWPAYYRVAFGTDP